MGQLARYFFTVGIVLIVLVFLDVVLVVGVSAGTHGDRYFVQVGKVSDSITKKGTDYVVEGTQLKKLDEIDAFLLIIGEDGRLVWQYHKPKDVPDKYSLSDVAGFSRWYLHDYPVYTWKREEGILVIGFPRDSLWKYTLEYRAETLRMFFSAMPYMIICNVLVLIVVPLWISGRWAKAKEKQRTEWIAGVSHDIRTPLSIVMANAPRGSVVEKQCFRIRDLVSNLNTENKLEAKTGKWNDTEIKIAALIREIVCDYINLGDERYSFEFDIDSDLENMVIIADEGLVRRMIDNLVSNAIRHNEEGCKVTVSMIKQIHNKRMLCIADDGKGVSEEVLAQMNGRLRQGYLPEHGLGIRVVKQIAKKYKYKITFQSMPGEYFECDIVFTVPKHG